MRSDGQGVADDPAFPTWLAQSLAGHTVEFVNIWDTNPGDGDWGFSAGRKPLTAAAWRTAFGAN